MGNIFSAVANIGKDIYRERFRCIVRSFISIYFYVILAIFLHVKYLMTLGNYMLEVI